MQSPAEKPRIAVVGAGYWGVNHVRNFADLRALDSVCDANPASLESISQKYPGVRTENDFKRLLENERIKGVVIATPAEAHYRMASAAIEAGKDVLVEKPL